MGTGSCSDLSISLDEVVVLDPDAELLPGQGEGDVAEGHDSSRYSGPGVIALR
jgi:hypothetical protein